MEAGERAGRSAGDRAGVGVTFGCCGRDIRKSGVRVQRTSNWRFHKRENKARSRRFQRQVLQILARLHSPPKFFITGNVQGLTFNKLYWECPLVSVG